MKSAFAFKVAYQFNYYILKLLFFCLFACLDGKGARRLKIFNQCFQHCIFRTDIKGYRENIRPQGFYSVFFPQGIYSLNSVLELTQRPFSFLLSLLSFPLIFILIAHTFFPFGWERTAEDDFQALHTLIPANPEASFLFWSSLCSELSTY